MAKEWIEKEILGKRGNFGSLKDDLREYVKKKKNDVDNIDKTSMIQEDM